MRKGFLRYLMSMIGRKDIRNEAGRAQRNYDFFDVGFHGDKYLLELVSAIAPLCSCFLETGSNVGSSLAYVGLMYPHLECLSCEPDTGAFLRASKNTECLPNVKIFNETSQEFLLRIKKEYEMIFSKNVLFWLDAHGYGFQWPLEEEIAFISTHFAAPYILIDDFKVPGLDCFGYDMYMGQECSFEYMKNALNPNLIYNLHYPNHCEKTSTHHPLRGWGLIEYGHGILILPNTLKCKIKSYLHIGKNSEKLPPAQN